jgi:hypothetical protein
MLFPISFCIPDEKIVNNIPKKIKILATCIPGNPETYIFDNEKDYYEDYQKSFFAITKKKAGWDCMRHYEIIANGCIPVFEEIEDCPINTMIHFPKSMIKHSNKLYHKFKDLTIDEIYNNHYEEYKKTVTELINYMQENLTTTRMALYILNNASIDYLNQNNKIKNVLFLSGLSQFGIQPDYLRCLLLHGFKQIFSSNCHDYPCIPHLYTDFPFDIKNLYGNGITYSKLLNKNIHRNNNLDKTIIEDIKNIKYDLIIYGNCHRGMPFLDIVLDSYQNNKNRIIFLCGEDNHVCQFEKCIIENDLTLFKR